MLVFYTKFLLFFNLASFLHTRFVLIIFVFMWSWFIVWILIVFNIFYSYDMLYVLCQVLQRLMKWNLCVCVCARARVHAYACICYMSD